MREMRDSGVEWIGEIPKDWDCCKQKYRFTLINGRAFKDNEFEEDGTYRILRVGNLFSNPVWYSSSLELESDKYCEKGDLIYAWSMSYGPYIWNEEKVIYHYHIWKTKLVSDMDKMFSYYYLQALTESIKSETHETTMGFVTMGIMNNSYIAYPRSIKEQKKISDYLDAKCSKIDEIIEKQQAIIEKLKEYRLSAISETVTKGLNRNVEMKDSQDDFVGAIPCHWEILKFGRCISVKSNLVPPDDYKDYPQISPDCIEKGAARLVGHKTVEESGVISWNHLFFKGQIIYSKIRPLLDKVVIAPFDGLCSADMYPIETSNNPKFVVYMMLSAYFHSQVALVTENRVKMPKINQNELTNITVVMPPMEEQKEIVEWLDRKCDEIDKNISARKLLIEKYSEYKKSLIYEVVTGKKEV